MGVAILEITNGKMMGIANHKSNKQICEQCNEEGFSELPRFDLEVTFTLLLPKIIFKVNIENNRRKYN